MYSPIPLLQGAGQAALQDYRDPGSNPLKIGLSRSLSPALTDPERHLGFVLVGVVESDLCPIPAPSQICEVELKACSGATAVHA